jgi:YggT family protein
MNMAAELIGFVILLLQLFVYVIVAQAILSWLVAFNVVNTSNRFVDSIHHGLDRVTRPVLRPIRNLLPDMGGIDLSPLVVILAVILVQRLLSGLQLDLIA